MNNTDQPKKRPTKQKGLFVPVSDLTSRDPKLVSERDLVYGALHGLPGYEAEWKRRNPGYAEELEEEDFKGYDDNY